MYGIKNYLPARPKGEDDNTIKEHVKTLKAEARKERQDIRLIEELMDLTMAERREGIVNNHWTIQQIKEEYPCLFNKDEVSLLCIKFLKAYYSQYAIDERIKMHVHCVCKDIVKFGQNLFYHD